MTTKIVEREIFPELIKHLFQKEVTVIVGARQTGKTTLLFQLKDHLIEKSGILPEQIKFFNLDLISELEGIKEQDNFIRFLEEELKNQKFLYVFIDEIQRLENPGQFLKGIYDIGLPIKFIVTGSSSLEIKSKITESLTGRKRVFQITPFSFSEYLKASESGLLSVLPQKKISTINQKKIFDHLSRYLTFGGYPRVVLAPSKNEKIQILNEIYSSYIEKDIVGFLDIKNVSAFSKLETILAGQIGNMVNLRELSNTLALNHRTIENYIASLEETFVIDLVRPFFTNARKELTKMPKVYFADTGLRNLAVKYFVDLKDNRDSGQLLENFVFLSLDQRALGTVNFWRTKDKNEVDFVFRDYFGNLMPIEVKAVDLKKSEIPRGLRLFIERYQPKEAFVVNLSLEEQIKVGKTKINFIPPYRIVAKSPFLK